MKTMKTLKSSLVLLLVVVLAALNATASLNAQSYEQCVHKAKMDYQECLLEVAAAMAAGAIAGGSLGPIGSIGGAGAAGSLGSYLCFLWFMNDLAECEDRAQTY